MNTSANIYAVCPFYLRDNRNGRTVCQDPGKLTLTWQWEDKARRREWGSRFCQCFDYTQCPVYQAMVRPYREE